MANPWAFLAGLMLIVIGTVGLVTGEGYINGRSAEGWRVRLPALVWLLAGLALAILEGIWGII